MRAPSRRFGSPGRQHRTANGQARLGTTSGRIAMETVRTVASRHGSRGEVVLRRRTGSGLDVDELIVNGIFAMDSSETSTERELANLALAGQFRRRVLLGGLGL